LTAPTGGWTWAKLQALEIELSAAVTTGGIEFHKAEIEVTTSPAESTLSTDQILFEFTAGHTIASNDELLSLTVDNATVTRLTNYTYEDEATLGTDDTDLASTITTSDVDTDDNIYHDVAATSNAVALFKYTNSNSTDDITITCKLKTDIAPSSSTVYLQIYNHNSASWETLDSDSTTAINTEFTLTGSQTTNLSFYYASNVVSARIYQVVI